MCVLVFFLLFHILLSLTNAHPSQKSINASLPTAQSAGHRPLHEPLTPAASSVPVPVRGGQERWVRAASLWMRPKAALLSR